MGILAFLKGALSTAVYGSLFNSLFSSVTGINPLGFLVDKLAGKKVTEKENLNLNNRLLNLTEKNKTPTQEGALRFLGDRSGRLDDAPDIEATNQSVLDNIAKNQSLALGTTVVPDLDTKQSVVDSFSGLVGIIQQINNNIGAIGQAMLESSVIESKYRQELIDDLEEEIAEKGKTRSRTRFERSIFNFATRQKNKIATKTGNLSKDLSKAIALSLGLEFGDLFLGDKDERTKEEKRTIKLMGDETKPKPEGFMRVLSGIGDFLTGGITDFDNRGILDVMGVKERRNNALSNKEETVKPRAEGGDVEKGKLYTVGEEGPELFVPNQNGTIIPNDKIIVQNNEEDVIQGEQTLSTKDITENINLNMNNNNFDSFQNIIPANNIDYNPLESITGTTQIIDLRTAKEIVGDTGSDNPTTVLNSSIASLDPRRRTSPYEGLVRSA